MGVIDFFKKRITNTGNPLVSNSSVYPNDFDFVDIGGYSKPYNNETTWLELYRNEPYIKGIIDSIINAIVGEWTLESISKKPSQREKNAMDKLIIELQNPRIKFNMKLRTFAYKLIIDSLIFAETSKGDRNFYVLNSEHCSLKWDKFRKYIVGIVWSKDGKNKIVLENGEYVFASLFDPDTSLYKATSLETAVDIANLLYYSRKYNSDIFKTGGVPSYMIMLDDTAQKDAVNDMKKLISKTRAGQHVIVKGNVKLMQLAGFTKDMEYNELIDYSIKSLMTLFNITPIMMSYTGGSAGEASRQEMNSFATNIHSKQKMLNEFMTEVIQNTWNVSEFKPYIKNFRFKLKKWVDVRQQSAIHKIYLDTTVLTPNEVRSDLGKEPVEWGDEPIKGGLQMGNTGGENPSGQNRDEDPDDTAQEQDTANGESDSQEAERR